MGGTNELSSDWRAETGLIPVERRRSTGKSRGSGRQVRSGSGSEEGQKSELKWRIQWIKLRTELRRTYTCGTPPFHRYVPWKWGSREVGIGILKGPKIGIEMGGSNELSSDRLADGTIPVERRRSTGISPVEVRQWGRDRGDLKGQKIGIEMRIQWIAQDRDGFIPVERRRSTGISPVEVRQPRSRSGFWTRAKIGIEMEDPRIKLRLTAETGLHTRGTPSGISPAEVRQSWGRDRDSEQEPWTSARLRQAAQQRVETAYAYGPRMLAHDRRILCHWKNDFKHAPPHCGRKTMLPAITQSVHDASTQIKTGHQDIRSYFTSNTSHHGWHSSTTSSNE
jgi:hypothetical protein